MGYKRMDASTLFFILMTFLLIFGVLKGPELTSKAAMATESILRDSSGDNFGQRLNKTMYPPWPENVILSEEAVSSEDIGIPRDDEPMVYPHIVAYGTYSDSALQLMASRYKLIVGLYHEIYGNTGEINLVKSLNPDVKIIYYTLPILVTQLVHGLPNPDWPEINSHEGWFLHDPSGNRIMAPALNAYVMDPRSIGWAEFYANSVLEEIEGKNLDGTFGDLVFSNIASEQLSSYPEAQRISSWYTDMGNFLNHVNQILGNNIFIVNAFDTDLYYQKTDGIMLENFCHPFWSGIGDQWEYAYDWRAQVNALSAISGSNKYFLAQGGVTYRNGPPHTDENRIMRYCLGLYLLGKNSDKATYYFVVDDWTNPDDLYSGLSYYTPDFTESRLGAPQGAYFGIPGTMLFERDFIGGRVIVNPTAVALLYTLPFGMRNIGDVYLTQLDMPAHSAEILIYE